MKRILFLAFFIFQNAQAENLELSEAYENEIIEEVKSVFQTKGTEEKVERPICATPIFLEIRSNWDRFSPKTKAILEPYTIRPTFNFQEDTLDTPHFRIHYVTQGDSAVPNEGWVDTCGEVLEHVWDTETGVLGYREPPSDYWYPDSNGGDGKYDVYLLDLADYLGYTQGENFISPSSLSATSFIVLDNDYLDWIEHSPKEWVQVTFAHEFFHAIQMGYDATECEYVNQRPRFYWMEMSSTWMEDMVYDNVNDYLRYLPSFFNNPEWSLKTFGYLLVDPLDVVLHPYGSCVWPIYLSEKFGRDIIKDIWDKCAEIPENNAIDYPLGKSATDKALEARGSNFEDAFREFTVWNYLTGDRARTQLFYSEGNLFPMVKVEDLHSHNSDTVESPSGPNHPYGLGSNYIVFKPTDKQGGIRLAFSPANAEYDFQISALGYNKDVNEPIIQQFQINQQTGYAETDVYNWTDYNQIIMIPAATSRNGNSFFPYTYSAKYDSSFHGEHLLPQKDFVGQNFPNPFVISGNSDSTYFPFILSSLSDVEINVFTISGELVWRYKEQEKTIGNYTQYLKCPGWDGKSQKGEYVASGIYLYQVKTKNANVVKKMAVIR